MKTSMLRLLSEAEMSTIYEKSLYLLSNKGVRVNYEKGLNILKKLGANVDFSNRQVCFPREIIENALRTVPHSVTLADGNKNSYLLPHPEGLFYTRSSTGAVSYIVPETNAYHDLTLSYTRECVQLVDILSEINVCGLPSPRDVPAQTADIHAFKLLLENTSKHIMVQPYGMQSLEYLFELALAVSGSEAELKKRPRIQVIGGSLAPLGFKDWNMAGILLICQYGVPLLAGCLASSGGTAPITIAGTALLSSVVILAMITMSQMIKPGTPVIGMPLSFSIDMLSGQVGQSTVESLLSTAACTQFVKEVFRIPVHTYGFGADAFIPDGQGMIESSRMAMLIAAAGGDILGGAGQLNVAKAISPVQLIIDNSLTAALKRLNSGVKVDDDTLAFQEILEVAPDGHFMDTKHTLRHCHDALRQDLFLLPPLEIWRSSGGKDLRARAIEEYQELKKKLQPQHLPEEVQKELDRIVRRADENLVK
ncbi:MAG: trimethylamine methyltransferase family protein [Chloroflexi bacterium]|nr:trimethylamine methyltransferase family protein [Chloroflexota bacterium]